ncbi:TauD/TfdA family dioxygenase [Streptomyces sp. CMB-StM0423]|uniref:TauD/TfdA family dioxygenase n=1 Tax=Streptomyces sp. CMB-StM0423 TaxID=2059884 RepID=UPI000C70E60D|nr:TauD/TfdA family dioxygenase [Streptomyces sp. CMB-StM0423]AUH39139.1 oxygenase [Streptomyces sp. CMB-StM0423]
MPTCPAPVRRLDATAAADLTTAAARLTAAHGSAASPALLAALPGACARLGDEVRHPLRSVDTPDGLVVLRGLPLDETEAGPTPGHWSNTGGNGALWDVVLLLVASLLGTPIAWEGQQDGRFVHDIVPAPGHESEQTGASSSVLLAPHTEDAFHPGRAHLLLLCCLRNHDRIATTAASIRRTTLAPADVRQLSRPAVPILPDDAYGRARQFAGPPAPVPTLFAASEGLTMRYDPAYTPLDDADGPWREAYRRLADELARVSVAVSLEPGDILVVDNDVVAHGRVPFRARYDGTDRWLKRASVRVPGRRTRPAAEADEHGYGQAARPAFA